MCFVPILVSFERYSRLLLEHKRSSFVRKRIQRTVSRATSSKTLLFHDPGSIPEVAEMSSGFGRGCLESLQTAGCELVALTDKLSGF